MTQKLDKINKQHNGIGSRPKLEPWHNSNLGTNEPEAQPKIKSNTVTRTKWGVYRDDGTHVESDRSFVLAPKMASNPHIQQLCTNDKVSFVFSSTEIERLNCFSNNSRDMISLVVDLLYWINNCRINIFW